MEWHIQVRQHGGSGTAAIMAAFMLAHSGHPFHIFPFRFTVQTEHVVL